MSANTAYLINTRPEPAACGTCHRVTLCGLDSGMSYKVDPIPLNLHGELAARLDGRRVYRLVAGHIAYREHEHINHGQDYPVIAEHSCTLPPPAHIHPGHVGAFLELIRGPAPPDDRRLMLAIDPKTNTLRPTHEPDPPPY